MLVVVYAVGIRWMHLPLRRASSHCFSSYAICHIEYCLIECFGFRWMRSHFIASSEQKSACHCTYEFLYGHNLLEVASSFGERNCYEVPMRVGSCWSRDTTLLDLVVPTARTYSQNFVVLHV